MQDAEQSLSIDASDIDVSGQPVTRLSLCFKKSYDGVDILLV